MANDPTDPTDEPTDPGERQMTTDRDQIRSWAEGRDAVPATVTGGEAAEPEYTFARREDVDAGDRYEARDWEEFFEIFEEGDMVFVYHEEGAAGDDLGSFELVTRDEVMDRAALEPDQVEEALMAGETVTTELTETRVIEREVVETDTIESELVDSDVLERDVVASEMLDRDVIETEFVDGDTLEVVVDEHRMDTVEEIEQLTVESRIVDVDVDVEERDEAHVDEFETSIADETIHRAILESNVTRGTMDVDELLDQNEARIQTNREGESIESRLIERRTVEEEVRDRRRMTFVLEDSEIVETEVMTGEVIEADLVDVEEYAGAGAGAGVAESGVGAGAGAGTGTEPATAETAGEAGMGDEMGTETGTEAEMGTGTEAGAGTEAETGASAGEGVGTGAQADESTTSSPIQLTDDDRGKNVVDATGEQVGIVADVEADTVYIDPEPGFVDRLKARFDWGEPDRDAYPVNTSQVREITDDEIVLEGE